MVYKIRYDGDADMLTVILRGKGRLSHAEAVSNVVAHYGKLSFSGDT